MELVRILRKMTPMDMVRKSCNYLLDPSYRFRVHTALGMNDNMPDEEYLCKLFYSIVGRRLNLAEPETFSEKLQWLKLYNHRPEYTIMVDKFSVKTYVANKIGEEYVVPTLGVWNQFDDIDFESLPTQFVLKCTHDSGGGTICKDRVSWNRKEAKTKLERSLRRNYYVFSREWPYKNVLPRIIAEPYLKEDSGDKDAMNDYGLIDYKFYCFHGKPRFLYVSEGLGGDHRMAKMSFLDLDWNLTPFQRSDFKTFSNLPSKPQGFAKMIEIASVLATGIPFVRVDLYFVNQRIYFSEFTFSPGGGFAPFSPIEWEKEIGTWVHLPIDEQQNKRCF